MYPLVCTQVCFLFSLKVVVAKWLHAQLLIWAQSHFCCVLRRMLFSYSAPLHPGVSLGTSNSRSKPQCHFIYTVTEPKKISNSANCMSYSILMWRCLTFIIWVSIWLTLLFPGHIFCSWMAICKNSLNTILTSLTVSVWNHICSKLFPSRIVIFYIHIFDFWYVVCKIHLSASSKQTLPGLDFHHSSPRPHLKGDILESRNA